MNDEAIAMVLGWSVDLMRLALFVQKTLRGIDVDGTGKRRGEVMGHHCPWLYTTGSPPKIGLVNI